MLTRTKDTLGSNFLIQQEIFLMAMIYVETQKKDFKRAEKALQHFPVMSKMSSFAGSTLKKEMDKQDPLSYPLLQW